MSSLVPALSNSEVRQPELLQPLGARRAAAADRRGRSARRRSAASSSPTESKSPMTMSRLVAEVAQRVRATVDADQHRRISRR